jgi:putative transposon-encoded protein
MNDRIKELAEQAFDKANDGTIPNIKIPKEFIGKFAELIIKKCVSISEAGNAVAVVSQLLKNISEFKKWAHAHTAPLNHA